MKLSKKRYLSAKKIVLEYEKQSRAKNRFKSGKFKIEDIYFQLEGATVEKIKDGMLSDDELTKLMDDFEDNNIHTKAIGTDDCGHLQIESHHCIKKYSVVILEILNKL